MSNKHRCKDCNYWQPDEDNWGDCHRMPPAATRTVVGKPRYVEYQEITLWPRTYRLSWCGEFSEKGDN